jgi:DNA polymerase-1
MENQNQKTFLLIDAHSLIHRAYHALPDLRTSEGFKVNAVYGFLLLLFKAIKDFQPDFVAAAFDLPSPTFRHKYFKEYKATRPKTPEDLSSQIPLVKEILRAFKIPIYEKEGFEADDVIGTICAQLEKEPSLTTIILSGDLDVLQLTSSKIKVFTPKRGLRETTLYSEKEVKERYQLEPFQLADFKALCGDPSDNIPGLKGIGPKTATQLIKDFGSLENLYQEIEKNSPKSQLLKEALKEKLINNKDQVFFSKVLATIKKDLEFDFQIEKNIFGDYDRKKIEELFKKWEFQSLVNRLPQPKPKENTLTSLSLF